MAVKIGGEIILKFTAQCQNYHGMRRLRSAMVGSTIQMAVSMAQCQINLRNSLQIC